MGLFFVITPGPVGASRELGLPGAMRDLSGCSFSGRLYSPGRHLLSGWPVRFRVGIFFVITPGPVGASRELGLPGAMRGLSGCSFSGYSFPGACALRVGIYFTGRHVLLFGMI